MIQCGGVVKVAVRRPDRLHVEFDGHERRSQIIFDRGTLDSLHTGRQFHV